MVFDFLIIFENFYYKKRILFFIVSSPLTSSFTADFDDNEDLKYFLDIFKCRTLVHKDNVYTVLCEISFQQHSP